MSIKASHVCVVIPAMNEEKTIRQVVSSVASLGYFVVVVDDGSDDGTVLQAKAAGARVLKSIKNMGAWKATQTGLRYARKKGYEVVVTMDGDGQHMASDIELLIEKYTLGANLVIGNCTNRGSVGRHIAWSFFKKLNGLNVSDITSGFRLYSSIALDLATSRQATMLEYQCIGVLIMARNLNLSVHEVSVNMAEREVGASRIFNSWFAVLNYLIYSSILSSAKAYPTNKNKYFKRLQD
ncbi:glycosyltransferase family 2 protein [Thalassotalea montiporae]